MGTRWTVGDVYLEHCDDPSALAGHVFRPQWRTSPYLAVGWNNESVMRISSGAERGGEPLHGLTTLYLGFPDAHRTMRNELHLTRPMPRPLSDSNCLCNYFTAYAIRTTDANVLKLLINRFVLCKRPEQDTAFCNWTSSFSLRWGHSIHTIYCCPRTNFSNINLLPFQFAFNQT